MNRKLLTCVLLFAFAGIKACVPVKPAPSGTPSKTEQKKARGTAVRDSIIDIIKGNGWTVPDGPDHEIEPRSWDLVHQQIQVTPDFKTRSVTGGTVLWFKPLEDPTKPIFIDAYGMEINEVRTIPQGLIHHYSYDSVGVNIFLRADRFDVSDSVGVALNFKAFPPDKTGMHFVDPDGLDEELPTQIWTLGQPEDNAWWFPTINRPDERTTHELFIKIPDSLTTVSNGVRIYARKNPGESTSTHYWRMDKPHAPYLMAFAAGKFAERQELANGVKLSYYVEPAYLAHIPAIFGSTPGAMQFLQDKTGVAYPWNGYSQVALYEFPAGGMENTGATFLFNGVQMRQADVKEHSQQDLIVHELAHQWFGNLVTCSDWSHLTIQEGMVTFMEYRYRRETDGIDAARYYQLKGRKEYFAQAETIRHPLIWKNYDDPMDLFDAHTYQKGGQVFWMLEQQLGDEVFFRALKRFLRDNAFGNATITDLQFAFERVAGYSLEPFFRQWFFEIGHPEIEITWKSEPRGLVVQLKQTHKMERQPRFRLQTELEFRNRDGSAYKKPLRWTGVDTSFTVPDTKNAPIVDVILDPDAVQLAVVSYPALTETDWALRLQHPSAIVRLQTLEMLPESKKKGSKNGALKAAVSHLVQSDPQWFVREAAIYAAAKVMEPGEMLQLIAGLMSQKESHPSVRLAALRVIAEDKSAETNRIITAALNDPSETIQAEAMPMFSVRNPDQAFKRLQPLAMRPSYGNQLLNAWVVSLENIPGLEAQNELITLARKRTASEYSVEAVRVLLNRTLAGGKLPDATITGFLDEMLQSFVPEKRMLGANGLFRALPFEASRPKLEKALANSKDEDERRYLTFLLKQGINR